MFLPNKAIETMVIQTYKTYSEIQYIERYNISMPTSSSSLSSYHGSSSVHR